MTSITFFIAVIVCLRVPGGQSDVMTYTAEKQSVATIDPAEMMERAKVVLRPPKNLTFFLVTSTEAVIGWLPPDVYSNHTYDVNTTLIDPPYNSTMVWLNRTYPLSQPSQNNPTPEPASNESSSATVTDTEKAAAESKTPAERKSSQHEICESLEFFANYTVDVNVSEEALKDYLPHLIRLKDIVASSSYTADKTNKDIVPYSQSCVREYNVFYHDNQTDPSNSTMVVVDATERPEVHLTSLKPGTEYTIYVAAVFVSNRTLTSTKVKFTTAPAAEPISAIKCVCDWDGTDMVDRTCKSNLSQPCDCRHGYQGRFCELCAPGFYRTAPYFPCHRCPCASHATRDNSCRFREGFLTCSECEVGYTGNICHMCAYGYYRHHKHCVLCNCNNNHNRSKPYMCDVITGACHCMRNVSGMNCEICNVGYTGDAIHLKNCAPEDTTLQVFKVLPQGVIAGICVAVVLLLSFIVGCIIYCRMSKNPPQRPFWTVELKDDHEGVNFNTVPNDDFQITDPKMTMDDMEFYEQQGGSAQSRSGGSSGQKYARLQENV